MTSRASTGAIARATSLSEKAIRLYADRGLLHAERDPTTGARTFDEVQVERARCIALLRSLDFTLSEVARVLDASDRVAVFDELWSRTRNLVEQSARHAEYARAVIAGTPAPLPGVVTQSRAEPEQLLLTLAASASLSTMGASLAAATGQIFDALMAADMPLAGPVHVEIRSRATETFPADLLVCAPIVDLMRPPNGMSLATDRAHDEVFVELSQDQADNQGLVVAVHDLLSAGPPVPTRSGRDLRPCGHNREVYLPEFGTGAAGVVMQIAVPVAVADVSGGRG